VPTVGIELGLPLLDVVLLVLLPIPLIPDVVLLPTEPAVGLDGAAALGPALDGEPPPGDDVAPEPLVAAVPDPLAPAVPEPLAPAVPLTPDVPAEPDPLAPALAPALAPPALPDAPALPEPPAPGPCANATLNGPSASALASTKVSVIVTFFIDSSL
jgi:hypothetical protein